LGSLHYAAPAAVSLGLALELFLKVLSLQHSGSHIQEHDLRQLWKQIPPSSQAVIADSYQKELGLLLAADNPPLITYITFDMAQETDQFKGVTRPDVSSIEAALSHLASTFERWRYLYENFDLPVQSGIDSPR
jgi:hypothetical protein